MAKASPEDARAARARAVHLEKLGYKNFENKFWWLEINIGQILTMW